MCEVHEKKLSPELASLVAQSSRPFRWAKAERLAKRFTRAVLEVWQELSEKQVAILPTDVQLLDLTGQKAFDAGTYEKDFFTDVNVKAVDYDLTALDIELIQLGVPREVVQDLHRLYDDISSQLISGSGTVQTTGGVFNTYYADTYKEGLSHASELAVNEWSKAPKRLREYLKENVSPVPVFQTTSAFVNDLYASGFELITSKVTKTFLGLAMETIKEGVINGDGWNTIASSLNKKTGTGAAWHWRRLVRTEMAGAFDMSSKEQFRKMEVAYLKMNTVPDACPICTEIRSRNGGWYTFEAAPSIPGDTHPNCRCLFLPKYNKPVGVVVNGE